MISTLTTAPAAKALDWDNQVKGHLRVDSDDEETRVNAALIPAASDWCEAFTGRQFITATWTCWWSSFYAAAAAARALCKYPSDTILIPKPPLQTVTHVKYYDTNNTIQTWAASNYTVVAPAGPKCGPGWLRPVPPTLYPSTYTRPDAVEIKFVCGYGTAYSDVPGGLAQAMLVFVGELFANREIAVTGTIVQAAPLGAVQLAAGYIVAEV